MELLLATHIKWVADNADPTGMSIRTYTEIYLNTYKMSIKYKAYSGRINKIVEWTATSEFEL